MKTLSLRLPDALLDAVQELASAEGISRDQFVTSAVAEKVSARMAEDSLQKQARRVSRAKYQAALAQVPDSEPVDRDGEITARLDRLYAQTDRSLDPPFRRVQRQSIGSETNEAELRRK